MNNPKSSSVLAGNFRENKKSISNIDNLSNGNDSENRLNNKNKSSLREASLLNKKLNDSGEGKNGLKKKISAAVGAAVNAGTSKLLQAAWENVIDSFGLTLIWINIHAIFLNPILGDKYFCKLGHEWTVRGKSGGPASLSSSSSGSSAVKGANSGASSVEETASRFLGLGEWMLLSGVDLIIILVLVALFAISSIVAGFFKGDWIEKIQIIWNIIAR